MKRMRYLDVAKGITIILVIIGHLITFNGFMWKWIFSFHMPFFFLTSGMCSTEKTFSKSFWAYLRHNISTLLVPAIIIRLFFVITGYGGVYITDSYKAILNYLLAPSSEWFISSLFLARVLFFFYFQMENRIKNDGTKKMYAAFFVVISLFCGVWYMQSGLHFTPSWFPFPLDCSLIALSFLVIGYWIRKFDILKILHKIKTIRWQSIVVAAVFILVLTNHNTYMNVSEMYFGRSDGVFFFIAVFWSIIVIFVSFRLMEEVQDGHNALLGKVTDLLECFGRNTMIVYIGHCVLFYYLNKIIYAITNIEYVPMHQFNNFLVLLYFSITMLIFCPFLYLKEKVEVKSPVRKNQLILCVLCLQGGLVFLYPRSTVDLDSLDSMFYGSGTREDPFIIDSVDALISFRDNVNSGISYSNVYFLQTVDLDLREIDNWEPIGIFDSGNYFEGYYNGNGHIISNLTIVREDSCALFGILGGEVSNLGISSGYIEGYCVGSIASHATSDGDAKIINCYNKATIKGECRAGGIADNFAGGIYFCWNYGSVFSDTGVTGGVVSYSANYILCSYSVGMLPVADTCMGIIQSAEMISDSELNSIEFINLMNYNIGRWKYMVGEQSIVLLGFEDNVISFKSSERYFSLMYIIGVIFSAFSNNLLDIVMFICVFILLISMCRVNRKSERLGTEGRKL